MADESRTSVSGDYIDLATIEMRIRRACPDWAQSLEESYNKLFELLLDGQFDGSAKTTLWRHCESADEIPIDGLPVTGHELKTGSLKGMLAVYERMAAVEDEEGALSVAILGPGWPMQELLGEVFIARNAYEKLLSDWLPVATGEDDKFIGLHSVIRLLSQDLPEELWRSLIDKSAYVAYLAEAGMNDWLPVLVFDRLLQSRRYLEPVDWKDTVLNLNGYLFPQGSFDLRLEGKPVVPSKFSDPLWERALVEDCIPEFQQWLARMLTCQTVDLNLKLSNEAMEWLWRKAKSTPGQNPVANNTDTQNVDRFKRACRYLLQSGKRPTGIKATVLKSLIELAGDEILLGQDGMIVGPRSQSVVDTLAKHGNLVGKLETDTTSYKELLADIRKQIQN